MGAGVVSLTRGTFNQTNPVILAKQGVWLRGAGQVATLLNSGALDIDAIQCLAPGPGLVYGVQITDMNILTNGAIKATKKGITATYLARAFLSNLIISHQAMAIDFESGANSQLDNLYLTDFRDIGIQIIDTTVPILTHIQADNLAPPSTCGLWIGGNTSGLEASLCDFVHCHNGLVLHGTAGKIQQWFFFNTTSFDFCDAFGVYVDGTLGQIQGITFSNSWVGSAGLHGIIFTGGGFGAGAKTQLVRFVGGKIFANNQHGVEIAAGYKISFDATDINGNNASNAGFHGINVENGAKNFAVRGCTIGNIIGGHQQYGIAVQAGGGTSDYIITHNDVEGNVIGGISDGGVAPKRVSRNLGYVTENSGASVGTGAQQTIAHGLGFTPTRQQIALTPGTATAVPFHSAAPDGTNIYVTATLNQAWYWATVGT